MREDRWLARKRFKFVVWPLLMIASGFVVQGLIGTTGVVVLVVAVIVGLALGRMDEPLYENTGYKPVVGDYVRHVASERTGNVIAAKRKWGTDCALVKFVPVMPGERKPRWVPGGVLQKVSVNESV